MSFLDSLESTLKSLESREERDPREHERRQGERAEAQAIAPWADALKRSAFADTLLGLATRAGHRLRTKIHLAWISGALRLELRERRLELRPTSQGIVAVFLENGAEAKRQPVDLEGNPEALLQEWLGE